MGIDHITNIVVLLWAMLSTPEDGTSHRSLSVNSQSRAAQAAIAFLGSMLR